MQNTNLLNPEKGKKGGGILRFWLKFGERSSNLEKTQMSPEFIELTKKYDTYKENNDVLVEKLESCIQQNKEVTAAGRVSFR